MVGIDILEVERIRQALKKESFLKRVFTTEELKYVQKYKDSVSHLAGFFCAKEAVMKALVDCKNISFSNIEICHEKSGKPFVNLFGNAKKCFEKNKHSSIEISISQTNTYATAICLIK